MTTKKIGGTPYHVWNPYSEMNQTVAFLGFGPTILTRGEGPYVFNYRGKKYINGNSSVWNVGLGFGRDELVEAATRQMRELPFSSNWSQTHPRVIELAAKLVQISSGNFQHVYFGSNGSEAVETAIKMARQYHRQSPNSEDHNRFKIISLKNSYHGFTYSAISAAGKDEYERKYGPLLPGFIQIEPPYCYRCPFKKHSYPECRLECAHALETTILKEGEQTVTAFILEPIMGEYGIVTPPDEYYQVVGEICHRYGLLFIADEVTTGFGRTGKLFASIDWKPQPDIMCIGKIISGGYMPLSAVLTTNTLFERF